MTVGDNEEYRAADTCMYFSRIKAGELATWLSGVDDNLIVRPLQVMKDEEKN